MSAAFRKLFCFISLFLLLPSYLVAQSTFTAQLSGVVTDSSGGVVAGAKVILMEDATNISRSTVTDERGIYFFTGLRPSTYTLRVEATNFATVQRKGVVLAVSQQATVDIVVTPGSVSEHVTVTTQAPLLETADAALGTTVDNQYVRDLPLSNRSFFGLVFLAGGVTETAGQGTQDSYPTGTNFVSNGQRNSTAEIRMDGALTSAAIKSGSNQFHIARRQIQFELKISF